MPAPRTCPHCHMLIPPSEKSSVRVMKFLGAKPMSVEDIAHKAQLSYMTVAPVMKYLMEEGRVRRDSIRKKGAYRAVYHYSRI